MERQDLSCTYLTHHELESVVVITITVSIIIVVVVVIITIITIIINACCLQVRILDRQQWVGSMAWQWFG